MKNKRIQSNPNTIYDGVLSRCSYLKEILDKVKHKSEGIGKLAKRVENVRAAFVAGAEMIPVMIDLLANLDAAHDAPEEWQNREAIGKAIAIALDIARLLGAEHLPVAKGDVFDCKTQMAVGAEASDLPPGRVSQVVFRGFRTKERVYQPQVLVARNDQQEQGSEKRGGRKIYATHEEYCEFVSAGLKEALENSRGRKWIELHQEKLLMVRMLNFDPVIEELTSLYGPVRRGSKPHDPVAVIRSLLLMTAFQQTGITNWAAEVRADPLLAIICGFEPGKTPSVGTYYHMQERLENGPFVPKCRHRVQASEMRRARLAYRMPIDKPQEKQQVARGVLEDLVKRLEKEKNEPLPADLERLLNEILLKVAVVPSADKKLLGDIGKLTAAADGSTLPSWAACNGKPTCDCRKQGIFRCEHVRKFSDIDAAWGWNNRIKDFVFGYRFYQFVSAESRHDLPLYLSIGPANSHEAVMALKALERWRKQNEQHWPQAELKRFSGDSIHDAYAFYGYLVDRKIRYAIPYANQPAKCLDLGQSYLFNDKGRPLCPGGLPMRRHGFDRQERRLYACPIKRAAHRNGKMVYIAHRDECPRKALCEPDSALGPLVHIHPDIDPRIHPVVPRDSKEYSELAAMRSCTERSNSAKKEAFRAKYARIRVMPYAYIRLALISLLEHSKVWAREKLEAFEKSGKEGGVLALFT